MARDPRRGQALDRAKYLREVAKLRRFIEQDKQAITVATIKGDYHAADKIRWRIERRNELIEQYLNEAH